MHRYRYCGGRSIRRRTARS